MIEHTTAVAPPNHHFVGKLSPKLSDRIIPRYVYNEASFPAHKLGSCVGLVTVHEDSAFVLRVFGRVDNERLSDAIAVIFGLGAR